MADDATNAYIKARADGQDAAIICDKWEIADAINRGCTASTPTRASPSVRVARDQDVRAGDIIISRNNDATITVEPGHDHRRGEQIDQVRNGNRWRVVGVDANTGRIAAERLTDKPASSSRATTCASTSPWATPPPCTPPKASPSATPPPAAPASPFSATRPAAPWPTSA